MREHDDEHVKTDTKKDPRVTFHGDSLVCLNTTIEILHQLHAKHVYFQGTCESIELVGKEGNSYAMVRCIMVHSSFKRYMVQERITFALDSQALHDILHEEFNDQPGELITRDGHGKDTRAVTFTIGETIVHVLAGTRETRLPRVAHDETLENEMFEYSAMGQKMLKRWHATRHCTFELDAAFFQSLVDDMNEVHAGQILRQHVSDPLDDKPVPLATVLLVLETNASPLEVGVALEFHALTGAIAESEFMNTFRANSKEILVHRANGKARVRLDMRFIAFLSRVFIPEHHARSPSMVPFTFHVAHEKPCVLELPLGKAHLHYFFAPNIEEDDDEGAPEEPAPPIEKDREGRWLTFIDDEYYQVSNKDFVEHVERYVDMTSWEVKIIEGIKHLVSVMPATSKAPSVRGSISLEDGSFALYDSTTGRRLQRVACRHLVLSHGTSTMHFQDLPLVQSVLATANTFTTGNFASFSPRILIDSTRGSSNAIEIYEDIFRELMLHFHDSHDVYKRMYYMIYAMYLLASLVESKQGEPGEIPEGPPREDLHDHHPTFFPDKVAFFPDKVAFKNLLREHLPASFVRTLCSNVALAPDLFVSTFARYVTEIDQIAGIIDVDLHRNYFYFDSSLHDVMVEAIILHVETTREEARQAGPRAPVSLPHADMLLVSFYYLIEYVMTICKKRDTSKEFPGLAMEAPFHVAERACDDCQAFFDQNDAANLHLVEAISGMLEDQLDEYERHHAITMASYLERENPFLMIPFISLLEKIVSLHERGTTTALEAVFPALTRILARITGEKIARIVRLGPRSQA